MALVLVLTAVVLLTVLIVAFFSRSITDRRVVSLASGSAGAELLGDTAVDYVIAQLVEEIQAGSDELEFDAANGDGNHLRVYVPSNGERARMVPERVADDGLPNVLKKSRGGTGMYTFGSGGRIIASPVSTETQPRRGSAVPRQRWNAPRLIGADAFGSFTAPDWVIVTREGPKAFEEWSSALRTHTSPDYAIGRFAFTIYDVGGLLDINVAGNALGEEENATRGRMHQVSLESLSQAVGGGNSAGLEEEAFIAWRSPTGGAQAGGWFDSARDFLEVPRGDQGLLGRSDLIAFSERNPDILPSALLEYLTVFSRDQNMPVLDHGGYDWSAADDPINQTPLAERYSQSVELRSGRRVPAGTPVLSQRFPLERLALLSDPALQNPDGGDIAELLAEIEYYFGLVPVTASDSAVDHHGRPLNPPYAQNWRYVATHNGRIARLSEIAAGQVSFDGEPRYEPNFFEILQAVIKNGALGRFGGNGMTTNTLDRWQNHQVMQIGANIIDQYDADDIPTTIRFQFGEGTNEVYGVENLPYPSEMLHTTHRPQDEPDRTAGWLLFELWNPHRNAAQAPQGIEDIRVYAVEGAPETRVWNDANWLTRSPNTPAGNIYRPDGGGDSLEEEVNDLTEVSWIFDLAGQSLPLSTIFTNQAAASEGELRYDGSQAEFLSAYAAHGNFAEPTMMGVRTTTASGIPNPSTIASRPGIFAGFADTPQPGVVGRGGGAGNDHITTPEQIELQRVLNYAYELVHPYTITASDGAGYATSKGGKGERIYQALGPGAALQFSGPDSHWHVEGNNTNTITVYARAGDRHRNNSRIFFTGSRPGYFDMQAKVDGQWITYLSLHPITSTRGGNPDAAGTAHREIANFNSNSTSTNANYFNWNSVNTYISFEAVDPRTPRFGLFFNQAFSSPNASIRNTASNWNMENHSRDSLAHGPVPGNHIWQWADPSTASRLAKGWVRGGNTSVFPTNFERLVAGSFMPAGLITNLPESEGPLSARHPMRYADPDGTYRPGDGWNRGAQRDGLPTVPGYTADRPVILNRPFRSVGELGHVFRGTPWRSLDFRSEYSGDAGLLEVFSVTDAPVVAGKVNLNSARPEIMEAMLEGINLGEPLAGNGDQPRLGDQASAALAAELRQALDARPLSSLADLAETLDGTTHIRGLGDLKHEREAAVRALAEAGMTGTWNLLIDLIAQSGRYAPVASGLEDFIVEGEARMWVHVAINRFTGEIVDIKTERVEE